MTRNYCLKTTIQTHLPSPRQTTNARSQSRRRVRAVSSANRDNYPQISPNQEAATAAAAAAAGQQHGIRSRSPCGGSRQQQRRWQDWQDGDAAPAWWSAPKRLLGRRDSRPRTQTNTFFPQFHLASPSPVRPLGLFAPRFGIFYRFSFWYTMTTNWADYLSFFVKPKVTLDWVFVLYLYVLLLYKAIIYEFDCVWPPNLDDKM